VSRRDGRLRDHDSNIHCRIEPLTLRRKPSLSKGKTGRLQKLQRLVAITVLPSRLQHCLQYRSLPQVAHSIHPCSLSPGSDNQNPLGRLECGCQFVPSSGIPCSFRSLCSAPRRMPFGFVLLPIPDRSLSLRIAPVGPRTSLYRPLIWWHRSRLVRSSGIISPRCSRIFGARVLPSSKQAP